MVRPRPPDALTFYVRCGRCGQRVLHCPLADILYCGCLGQHPAVSHKDQLRIDACMWRRMGGYLQPVDL